MSKKTCHLGLYLLFATFATTGIAQKCSLSPEGPAQRVFAKVKESRGWREYKNLKAIPELNLDAGISAEYWKSADGSALVRIVEPGEDYWAFTMYCFAGNRKLVSVEFELRTAWGWSYRDQVQSDKGVPRQISEAFYDIKSMKPIPRPGGADQIAGALKPNIFVEEKDLPFFRLLDPAGADKHADSQ